MENIWTFIPLLVIIVVGLLYYGFKDDYHGDPKELVRKIGEASLGTLASFLFGLFGFNLDLLNGKNGSNDSSKRD